MVVHSIAGANQLLAMGTGHKKLTEQALIKDPKFLWCCHVSKGWATQFLQALNYGFFFSWQRYMQASTSTILGLILLAENIQL